MNISKGSLHRLPGGGWLVPAGKRSWHHGFLTSISRRLKDEEKSFEHYV
jgi:hypothetical protein